MELNGRLIFDEGGLRRDYVISSGVLNVNTDGGARVLDANYWVEGWR